MTVDEKIAEITEQFRNLNKRMEEAMLNSDGDSHYQIFKDEWLPLNDKLVKLERERDSQI